AVDGDGRTEASLPVTLAASAVNPLDRASGRAGTEFYMQNNAKPAAPMRTEALPGQPKSEPSPAGLRGMPPPAAQPAGSDAGLQKPTDNYAGKGGLNAGQAGQNPGGRLG